MTNALRDALKDLMSAYVRLLESGRDRIVTLGGTCDLVEVMEAGDPDLRAARAALAAPMPRDSLREALDRLTNAKALAGVRPLVAGWNGEGRNEPYNERHPRNLGAKLPTTCGEVYDLDDALTAARAALDLPPPCELPACEVARIWLNSESLHYRTVFDDGALTRLTAVIQRARNDGYALGRKAPSTIPPADANLNQRDISEAPLDGTEILVAVSYRYHPYKPDGARQMRVAGRWQVMGDNGWENTERPEKFLAMVTA
jgi:hypothetical protein